MITSSPQDTPGLHQYQGIYLKRIPCYSFSLMLEFMAELGVANTRILNNTELTPDGLASDGTLVSFIQALKFVRNILATSPRPDVGLLMGDRFQINTYGVLGYAMMSCPTWGDALRLGNEYHRVASSLMQLELEYDQVTGTLSYIALPFYPDLVDVEPFTVEKLFASLIAVSRPLLAEAAVPLRVSFTYPKPDYIAAYEQVFPCPMEFNAAQNRFELGIDTLQQPLLMANAISAEIGRKMCVEIMGQQASNSGDFTRKVMELLLCSPGRLPGMTRVAEQLHIGERTLRRRLQSENTTFQDIVDRARQDLARHYLKRSELSLDDIAQLVGFTETTNFRRAFKRWEGLPPAHYRRANSPANTRAH